MADKTSAGSPLLRPENTTLIPLFINLLNLVLKYLINNFIKSSTSSALLLKLSVEKAYTLNISTPISIAWIANFSRILAPSLCPSLLLRLRFAAHLPFPSIIIATCFGTFIVCTPFE